jgi:hypothetical protein
MQSLHEFQHAYDQSVDEVTQRAYCVFCGLIGRDGCRHAVSDFVASNGTVTVSVSLLGGPYAQKLGHVAPARPALVVRVNAAGVPLPHQPPNLTETWAKGGSQ